MPNQLEQFKTINFFYFKSNKKKLLVIIPRAGATIDSHRSLIDTLDNIYDIIFIDAGFLGKNPVDKSNYQLFLPQTFRTNLKQLLSSLSYKKVEILAESVGALYAIDYALKFDGVSQLYLSNPAVYRSNLITKWLGIPFLKLSLMTSPGFFLKLVTYFTTKVPLMKTNLAATFKGLEHSVGARSYLMCLDEIASFGMHLPKDIKTVLAKTVVLVGENDRVFKNLCNKELFMGADEYIEISKGEHKLIDENYKAVAKTISGYN